MKKILAVAIATAFAAPAFAATSNVDVYGKLHVSVSMFDDQPVGTNDLQISSNASRFGIKGSEDLGGGLAAIWQFEQTLGLDEDGTSGALASRNSFLGLKGAFGTALVGRHDTPLKGVGRAVDLFGDTMADSRNVMSGNADGRPDNVVAYMSPNFTGLSFAAAYISATNDGTAGDTEDTDMYSLSATYTNGPLYLGLGFGDGDGLGTDDKMWRLGAGYTMGNLKFVGQYDSTDSVSGLADSDAWMLGMGYTMGNIVLKANYMERDIDNTSNDPQQWTIGADYNLSKRTAVYVLYANGEYITIGSGAGSSDRVGSGVAGGDVSALSLGMTHTF